MLEMSQQVLSNLAFLPSRDITRATTTAATAHYLCAVFVSNAVPFPTTYSQMTAYVNSALNGSSYYGGTPGNEVNCLAIAEGIPSCSISGNTCFFDGASSFTARESGTIGGVIFTYLYGTSAAAPSTFFPLTSATTAGNAATYLGTSKYHSKTHAYLFATDSIGTTGNTCVTVDSLELVSGQQYTLYGASLTFKDKANG